MVVVDRTYVLGHRNLPYKANLKNTWVIESSVLLLRGWFLDSSESWMKSIINKHFHNKHIILITIWILSELQQFHQLGFHASQIRNLRLLSLLRMFPGKENKFKTRLQPDYVKGLNFILVFSVKGIMWSSFLSSKFVILLLGQWRSFASNGMTFRLMFQNHSALWGRSRTSMMSHCSVMYQLTRLCCLHQVSSSKVF